MVDRHLALGISQLDQIPVVDAAPIVGHHAIAHHLGVDAAVVGEVDLLGHQPIQRGADLGRGMIHLEVEGGRLGNQA